MMTDAMIFFGSLLGFGIFIMIKEREERRVAEFKLNEIVKNIMTPKELVSSKDCVTVDWSKPQSLSEEDRLACIKMAQDFKEEIK